MRFIIAGLLFILSSTAYGGEILGLSPNHGKPGESLSVRIVAFDVPASLSASQISFGKDIGVNAIEGRIEENRNGFNISFIRVQILIDNSATLGKRKIRIVGVASSERALFYVSPESPVFSFSNLFQLPSGKNPSQLLTARLNQDNQPEVLLLNQGDLASNGFISMVPTESNILKKRIQRLFNPFSPVSFAPGDFNEDGKGDLAVLHWPSSDVATPGGITIFVGDGKGRLKRTVTIDASNSPISIASGDINRDGHIDLAICGLNEFIRVFYGNGKLSFTEQRIHSGRDALDANFSSIAIGDIDFDNLPDLLVADQTLGGIVGFLAIRGGNFSPPMFGHAAQSPFSMIAGDWDRNGSSEIAATVSFRSMLNLDCCGRNTLLFNRQRLYATGDFLHTADLNGDGDLELIATSSLADIVTIFPGKPGPFFGIPVTFETGKAPTAVSSGDWNNDGEMDLVVAERSERKLRFLTQN